MSEDEALFALSHQYAVGGIRVEDAAAGEVVPEGRSGARIGTAVGGGIPSVGVRVGQDSVDAREGGVLFGRLIDTHPVEARFVDKSRVGMSGPTAIAHTLVEDEVERSRVRPLAVGQGIGVGTFGCTAHLLAVHVPSDESGRPLCGKGVIGPCSRCCVPVRPRWDRSYA